MNKFQMWRPIPRKKIAVIEPDASYFDEVRSYLESERPEIKLAHYLSLKEVESKHMSFPVINIDLVIASGAALDGHPDTTTDLLQEVFGDVPVMVITNGTTGLGSLREAAKRLELDWVDRKDGIPHLVEKIDALSTLAAAPRREADGPARHFSS